MPTRDPARRLWIDVSTLIRLRGNATGIVRTLSELLRHWLADGERPVHLCRFDRLMCAYRPVLAAELRAAPPPPAPPGRARAADRSDAGPRETDGRWSGELREARWHLSRAARDAGRLARSIAFDAGSRGLRAVARRLRRPPEAPFAPGDAVLAAGDGWHYPAAGETLLALQRTLGLRVAHLVYDVTPLRHPQWCHSALTHAFADWLPRVCAGSKLILTISEHSRRDLVEYGRRQQTPVPPIEAIRLGDEPGEGESAPAGFLDRAPGAFALFVSTISLHKNQTLLFHVWRRLLDRHGAKVPPLVLVGQSGWRADEILRDLRADAALARHVVHLASVNDRELRWLYRRCLFTLYPSHYEGWGLPVAESLIFAKHCICSDASSLPEVGGALVDYHDPLDAPACQALVERALFEPGWLAQREERIRREYRTTSWKDCARQTMQILERGLELPSPRRVPEAA